MSHLQLLLNPITYNGISNNYHRFVIGCIVSIVLNPSSIAVIFVCLRFWMPPY